MKVPNVQTNKGVKPLTALPNKALIDGFIYNSDNSEDVDLVRLMSISSEVSPRKAASILRKCLTKGRNLVAVHPALNETPPKNAEYVCGIMEGAIYLV